jgi:Amt family ammonium transporter
VDAYFDDQAGGFQIRRLEFTFARVGRDDQVERLFAVVRDTTDKKELAEEIEKTRNENRQEMEMLQRILHIDPQVLTDFLESAKDDAEAINDELRSGGENFKARLDAIFRHSHSIKGDAQLLALDFLADKAEDLERRIQGLREKKEISAEDFLPLTISCSQLMESIEKLGGIINKWLRLSDSVRGSAAPKSDGFSEVLEGMAKRLAKRYGKELVLTITGFAEYSLNPGKRRALQDVLVQLVRNSVYHGIETPAERRAAGKPEKGQISIKAHSDEGNFYVVYRDDGAGIDREKVKNKAVALGLISAEKAKDLPEQDKIRFIFHPGFSTADKPDNVAGKGVGLALVNEKVKEMGGRFALKSRFGSYCEFNLSFPILDFMDEGILPEENIG